VLVVAPREERYLDPKIMITSSVKTGAKNPRLGDSLRFARVERGIGMYSIV
jgi:hypothetical protein